MSEQSPAPPPRSRAAGYAVLAVAVVLALGAGAYLVLGGGDSKPSSSAGLTTEQTGPLEPNRPKEGEKAPNFALADVRDPRIVRRLSDFAGKAIVVNWYASWCGPCIDEIPEFQAAQQALGDQVVFLGVDYQEDQASALSILSDLKATYPAVLDAQGAVADHYRVGQGGGGLPTTFFLDKDGVLRGQVTGRVTPEKLTENLAKVGLTYRAQ